MKYNVIMKDKNTLRWVFLSVKDNNNWCKFTANKHMKDVKDKQWYIDNYKDIQIIGENEDLPL